MSVSKFHPTEKSTELLPHWNSARILTRWFSRKCIFPYRQWFHKRILSIQRANVLGRMFRTHVRWISILNPAQIVEGPHQRGLGLVWKSIVLKGLKVFTMPGKITDSKMKYEGVQTTNKTIRVYNFARWDGCWCIYIWVVNLYLQIYKSDSQGSEENTACKKLPYFTNYMCESKWQPYLGFRI